MINLEKIKQGKCHPPFNHTCACTIIPAPFFNFSDFLPLLPELIKGVLNYAKHIVNQFVLLHVRVLIAPHLFCSQYITNVMM